MENIHSGSGVHYVFVVDSAIHCSMNDSVCSTVHVGVVRVNVNLYACVNAWVCVCVCACVLARSFVCSKRKKHTHTEKELCNCALS